MKCTICQDKGILYPENPGEAFAKGLHETSEEYLRRVSRIVNDMYCKCRMGQRILFMHRKAEQLARKSVT